MITDMLLIQRGTGSEASLSVLITDNGAQTWANGGARNAAGEMIVPLPDYEAELIFVFRPAGVRLFKDRRANGEENAHHTIVGVGKIGDHEFVGFPSKDGKSIGLKPSIPTESTPIDELA